MGHYKYTRIFGNMVYACMCCFNLFAHFVAQLSNALLGVVRLKLHERCGPCPAGPLSEGTVTLTLLSPIFKSCDNPPLLQLASFRDFFNKLPRVALFLATEAKGLVDQVHISI